MQSTYKVTGMHCASCVSLLEDVCKELPGVRTCTVLLEQGRMTVEYEGAFSLEAFNAEIGKLGSYRAESV